MSAFVPEQDIRQGALQFLQTNKPENEKCEKSFWENVWFCSETSGVSA